MLKILGSTSLAAALALSGVAHAADPVADQRTQLEKVKFLVGNWTCEGQGYDPTSQSLKNAKGTFSVTAALDGTWLEGKTDGTLEGSDAKHSAISYLSYDSVKQKFVKFIASNDAVWGYAWSDGANGSTWTWDGEVQNAEGHQNVKSRETLKQTDNDSFTVKFEIKTGSGWTVGHTGTCNRD